MKKIFFITLLIVASLFVFSSCGEQLVLQTNIVNPPPPPSIPEKLWVPILVYHRIEIPPANAKKSYLEMTITPEWLNKHLKYLQENGFHTISFADLAEAFKTGKPLPEKPVIISFDDGYKSFYTNALPILKKYNISATLFVVAGYTNYGAYLNWDKIKEIHAQGIEIGSHSMSHAHLTKAADAEWQITESKRIIEENIGSLVTVFAYPYGEYNEKIEAMVKAADYKVGRSFYSSDNWVSVDNLFHTRVIQVNENIGLEKWEKHLFEPKL